MSYIRVLFLLFLLGCPREEPPLAPDITDKQPDGSEKRREAPTNPAESDALTDPTGEPAAPVGDTLEYPGARLDAFVDHVVAPLLPSKPVGATGFSVSPSLPAGLVLDPETGALSGTPSRVHAAEDFVISAHGGALSATVRIEVLRGIGNMTEITENATDCDCEAGSAPNDACMSFTVAECAGTAPVKGCIKVSEASTTTRGTIILGGGGGGEGFFESVFCQSTPQGYDCATPVGFINDVRALGYRVVQRRWLNPEGRGWMKGGGGPGRLACRYATLADYVYREIHAGAGAFCGVGQSGGSGELGYALAHYGLGRIFDQALLTGGPPMGRLDWGCGAEEDTWLPACWSLHSVASGACQFSSPPAKTDAETGKFIRFNGPTAQWIDETYAEYEMSCRAQSTDGNVTRWREDSVLSTRPVLFYPQTDVRFVFGDGDASEAVPLGLAYAQQITSGVSITMNVPDTPHAVPSTGPGVAQILSDVEVGCVVRH